MRRNTPTCVGKTNFYPVVRLFWRKHPHVRGEDETPGRFHVPRSETPPRAWGRPLGKSSCGSSKRNTPTCVGKTGSLWLVADSQGKHPHVRGEDTFTPFTRSEMLETPPRAWGRPRTARSSCRHRQKHPHVRGEDRPLTSSRRRFLETPPRAWGRLPSNRAASHHCRNTPTCVGKTRRGAGHAGWTEKHPHVRGEDTFLCNGCCRGAETPPRAWGRLVSLLERVRSFGNTPTCVGKTQATTHR